MRYLLFSMAALLASCGGSGGSSDGGHTTPAPVTKLTISATAPPVVYYSPSPTHSIDITMQNTGTVSAYTSFEILRDGAHFGSVTAETLAPGQAWAGGFALWNASGEGVTHVFTVRAVSYDWMQDFTINYPVRAGG